jgi:hypothetical protein
MQNTQPEFPSNDWVKATEAFPAKQAKRCATCGDQEVYRNKSYCRFCIYATAADRLKKLRAKPYQCSKCGLRNRVLNRKRCQLCLDREANFRKSRKSRKEKKATMLVLAKAVGTKPLSKCSRCKLRYTVPEFKLCQLCQNGYRLRARRLVRQGKCSTCRTRDPVLGLKTCQMCRDKRRAKCLNSGVGDSVNEPLVAAKPVDAKPFDEKPHVPKLRVSKLRPRSRQLAEGKCSNSKVGDPANEPLMVAEPVDAKRRENSKEEDGKCGSCHKNDAHPGRLQCESCIQAMKGVLAERKALGICADCNNRLSPGTDRCETHLAEMREHRTKKREYTRTRVLRWSLDGKCTICGKNQPRLGSTCCSNCADRKAQSSRKYNKTLSEKRNLDGKCARCGTTEPRPGYTWCSSCRDIRTQYQKKYRETLRGKYYRCKDCDNWKIPFDLRLQHKDTCVPIRCWNCSERFPPEKLSAHIADCSSKGFRGYNRAKVNREVQRRSAKMLLSPTTAYPVSPDVLRVMNSWYDRPLTTIVADFEYSPSGLWKWEDSCWKQGNFLN